MTAETASELLALSLHIVLGLSVAGHALLHKRDPRSAWAWILACVLLPVAGASAYFLFGINRVKRRARVRFGSPPPPAPVPADEVIPHIVGTLVEEIAELVHIGRAVTGRALTAGNRITPLHNGEEAYPAFIEAINQAKHHVWLMSYIFDNNGIGERMAAALRSAQDRGVQVRVLLDGFGTLALLPGGHALLRRHGIKATKFLPPRLFPPLMHFNLRNHRKLLCIDGRSAFIGGMNIGDHHLLPEGRAKPRWWQSTRIHAEDLHFHVQGPVVSQLDQVFVDDWKTARGENLDPGVSAARVEGDVRCRVITDGPNEDFGRYQLILLGALANAHRSVCIMTPYFVPTPELSSAITSAALRGIEVTLLLPARSNHWWLDAATRRWLLQMASFPVKIYLRPPPFAHSKLFIVDNYYTVIGSANLDPRSLRLNFELMLECYEVALAERMLKHFLNVRDASLLLDIQALKTRPLASRLWDAVFWLFSPSL